MSRRNAFLPLIAIVLFAVSGPTLTGCAADVGEGDHETPLVTVDNTIVDQPGSIHRSIAYEEGVEDTETATTDDEQPDPGGPRESDPHPIPWHLSTPDPINPNPCPGPGR